jgi:hypothetical protein
MTRSTDNTASLYWDRITPVFQDLHHVAARLTTWLAVQEVEAHTCLADRLTMAVARELLVCSQQDIETCLPPAAAQDYHGALRNAARHLARAFPLGSTTPVHDVRLACRELERASRLLPHLPHSPRRQARRAPRIH